MPFGLKPQGAALTPDALLRSANEAQLSGLMTFGVQAQQSFFDSFGAGTAITEAMTPDGAPTNQNSGELLDLSGWAKPGQDTADLPTIDTRPLGESDAQFAERRKAAGAMSEEEWKQSQYYRPDIKWDERMNPERAAALAEWNDWRKTQQDRLDRTSAPVTKFLGGFAGAAADPINYVPVLGPTARAWAVARLGRVGGTALTASADAMLNTALAAGATYNMRQNLGMGDTFEETALDIAMAGLIGAAFGGVVGKLDSMNLARQQTALRNVQTAERALNDAATALSRDGQVKLTPPIAEQMTRMVDTTLAEVEAKAVRGSDTETPFTTRISPAFREQFPDIAKALDEDLSPRQFAERAVREQNPDLARQFDELSNVVKTNEDVLAGLRSENMDDATFRDTRAAMTRAEQIDDKIKRLERAQGKAASEKERTKLQGQIDTARSELEGVLKTIDGKKLDRLGEIESQIALREQALADARAKLDPLKQQFDGSVRAQIQRFIRESVNAREPVKADISAPPPEAPDPAVIAAEPKVGKPTTIDEMAEDFDVDPESGTFPEMDELDAMIARQEAETGRPSAARTAMEESRQTLDKAKRYGKALKVASECLL
ncbi:MAG: hypothetical protein ACK515_25225 [bacterium]